MARRRRSAELCEQQRGANFRQFEIESGECGSPDAARKTNGLPFAKSNRKGQATRDKCKADSARSACATRPAEWLGLENKPATQLERSRIRSRAGVGVKLS